MSVLALDLGSTRVKAARIDSEGEVLDFAERPAPPLSGEGLRREFDALELERRVAAALGDLSPRRGERLGIASQRSTMLLWSASDGTPLTPAISWQDRSAAAWVEEHGHLEPLAREVAGLPLSAHYVGPKLAAIFAARPDLARRAARGELRAGTLDAWLAFRWTGGRCHATDESMAARTLLLDPELGAWSPRLCEAFQVPPAILPEVVASPGREHELDSGLVLVASAADQSAGALHAAGTGTAAALINFGTGTFVLVPSGSALPRRPGYLSSLLCARGTTAAVRRRDFAVEGTINAGAALLARGASADGVLRAPPGDAWALVDESGIGAPHWRAQLGPSWSPAAAHLDPAQRAVVAETGLFFRVREILSDLGAGDRRWVVAGGPLHDPAFAARLARALGRPIEACLDPEATLLGIAHLAAGGDPARARARTRRVDPGGEDPDMARRFAGWRAWVSELLAR